MKKKTLKRIHYSPPIAILGLQPRDKAAMLVVNTKEIFLLNLYQNRVHFPAERNAFVLDHQHGRRDVTCKPAIRETHSHVNRFYTRLRSDQKRPNRREKEATPKWPDYLAGLC